MERAAILADYIETWQPAYNPQCANCLEARVYGDPEDPVVRCSQGHGADKMLTLTRMLRPKLPRGFRAAVHCPDWEPAEDEPRVYGWKPIGEGL